MTKNTAVQTPSGHRTAVIAFFSYLALAACLGGRLPFVQWTMFRFSMPTRDTVTPLFLADGKRAPREDFTSFVGLPPSVVDLAHVGFESSVEHKFHELELWLEQNQAPRDASSGPVEIQIGLTILSFDEEGRVVVDTRIDATGSAHGVQP